MALSTGMRIKLARVEAGLTQKELAEKLYIPYQSINQWERGKRNPKLETLRKIANALGIPLETFIDMSPSVQKESEDTGGINKAEILSQLKLLRCAADSFVSLLDDLMEEIK